MSGWPEHLVAPAGNEGEDPRAEVSRRVDGIAAVWTHGDADYHNHCSNQHRLQTGRGGRVTSVTESQNTHHQGRCADHLRSTLCINHSDLFDEIQNAGPIQKHKNTWQYVTKLKLKKVSVDVTWSTTPPHTLRYSAGYVEKIPAVAVGPLTVRSPLL